MQRQYYKRDYLCPIVEETKIDFERIYKDYYLRGLSKLVIYRFGEANGEMSSIVPPEFSDKITVRSAESIF